MNECKRCKALVYPQHGGCPLCGKPLGEPAQSETSYPKYAGDAAGDGFTVKRLFLFASIVACALSVFINMFTLDAALNFWSVVVVLSLTGVWLIIFSVNQKNAASAMKILRVYGIISVYLVALDIYIGFFKWSVTYVIPFLTIATAMIFTAMAIGNKKNYREYLGYLIAIFFISFIPIVIFVFSIAAQAWTSFTAMLYCLLTIAGLIIFSGGKFKHEIKKRFHY